MRREQERREGKSNLLDLELVLEESELGRLHGLLVQRQEDWKR